MSPSTVPWPPVEVPQSGDPIFVCDELNEEFELRATAVQQQVQYVTGLVGYLARLYREPKEAWPRSISAGPFFAFVMWSMLESIGQGFHKLYVDSPSRSPRRLSSIESLRGFVFTNLEDPQLVNEVARCLNAVPRPPNHMALLEKLRDVRNSVISHLDDGVIETGTWSEHFAPGTHFPWSMDELESMRDLIVGEFAVLSFGRYMTLNYLDGEPADVDELMRLLASRAI